MTDLPNLPPPYPPVGYSLRRFTRFLSPNIPQTTIHALTGETDRDLPTVVGTVETQTDGPAAWISDLYVTPRHRRAGVARALVLDAIRKAIEHGCESVSLRVARKNVGAFDLYASLGFFVAVAEGKGKMLVMVRRLPQGSDVPACYRPDDDAPDTWMPDRGMPGPDDAPEDETMTIELGPSRLIFPKDFRAGPGIDPRPALPEWIGRSLAHLVTARDSIAVAVSDPNLPPIPSAIHRRLVSALADLNGAIASANAGVAGVEFGPDPKRSISVSAAEGVGILRAEYGDGTPIPGFDPRTLSGVARAFAHIGTAREALAVTITDDDSTAIPAAARSRLIYVLKELNGAISAVERERVETAAVAPAPAVEPSGRPETPASAPTPGEGSGEPATGTFSPTPTEQVAIRLASADGGLVAFPFECLPVLCYIPVGDTAEDPESSNAAVSVATVQTLVRANLLWLSCGRVGLTDDGRDALASLPKL